MTNIFSIKLKKVFFTKQILDHKFLSFKINENIEWIYVIHVCNVDKHELKKIESK